MFKNLWLKLIKKINKRSQSVSDLLLWKISVFAVGADVSVYKNIER